MDESCAFVVPPAERIKRGHKNQVRYFVKTESERLLAETVQTLTVQYFKEAGCPLSGLDLVESAADKPSPLELWIVYNCK